MLYMYFFFFFSSRRRHTRLQGDWSSDVCSSDLSQARHYQSGILFDELTAETASARTMLLLTRQGAPDAAPLLHLTGIYHDRWRKTREGWRLVHRAARVDRDPGYAKHWA